MRLKNRFSLFSPLILIFFLVSLFFILNNNHLFLIRKVDCFLDKFPCPLIFEPILIDLHNKNIFALKTQAVIASFYALENSLGEIKLKKQLPGKITILLTRRLPITQVVMTDNLAFEASLSGELTSKIFLLDQAGAVFKQSEAINNQLPTISLASNLNFGLGQSALSQSMAQLVLTLNSYFIKFTSLAYLEPNIYIIKTGSGPYAVFSSEKDFSVSVGSLQYILSGFKIGESLPTKIDLRFDKPILSY